VWLSWLSPVAGSTVVGSARIGSQSGTFVGIDLENSSQRWTTDVSTDIPYPMTAASDDTVFVYSGDDYADTFYALDVETGDTRWTVGGADFAPFPPVVLESAVVIDLDGEVQARDPKTGEQIVSTDELEGYIEATGSGRTIFLYSLNRAAYQL